MGGTAVVELEGLYRRAGLKPKDIPADYLGTMLECAAYLQEQGLEGLSRELTEEHLERWVPKFARDLTESARLDLYRKLGTRLGNLFPLPDDD
jgi:TorA maturation chaperone TorD